MTCAPHLRWEEAEAIAREHVAWRKRRGGIYPRAVLLEIGADLSRYPAPTWADVITEAGILWLRDQLPAAELARLDAGELEAVP